MKKIKITFALIVTLLITFSATGVFADSITPYRQGFIEGFLIDIEDSYVIIEEYDGTSHILQFNKNPVFSIDTLNVSLGDFREGMEVYATLENKTISYMEGFSTVNPGYIQEGSKVKTGTIKLIDRDQIIIKLDTGEEKTYFTSPATILLKDGKKVSFNTLYEGDRVKLYFDSIDTMTISKMAIQGKSIEVKGVYKGKLVALDEVGEKLTLTDIKIFKNGGWEELSGAKTIAYSEECPIYIGGINIPISKLKYYMGNTVYLAIKDFFSDDRIESMVIKNQYETTYLDTIEEMNWYGDSMELEKTHRNLTFNEGTIIIKNGRLVDTYSLEAGMDAFIVGDGRNGDMSANVIYVYNENINNSNIGQDYLYEGRLDAVFRNSVLLEDFALLDKNAWEGFSSKKELYYDEDTMIYDLENEKLITPEEFYYGEYAVDEDSDYAYDLDYEDWYAYIYADGDRISSIMVQKDRDSLLRQRITNGIVITKPEDHDWVGWRINIDNASDWSSRKEKWMQRKSSFYLNLEEALIIKDGKIIKADELKLRDRLYIVRDSLDAKVVIVK